MGASLPCSDYGLDWHCKLRGICTWNGTGCSETAAPPDDDDSSDETALSPGVIVGISVGAVAGTALVGTLIFKFGIRGGANLSKEFGKIGSLYF